MRGINEQVLKTSGDDVFSSRRKLRKTSEGSGNLSRHIGTRGDPGDEVVLICIQFHRPSAFWKSQ